MPSIVAVRQAAIAGTAEVRGQRSTSQAEAAASIVFQPQCAMRMIDHDCLERPFRQLIDIRQNPAGYFGAGDEKIHSEYAVEREGLMGGGVGHGNVGDENR